MKLRVLVCAVLWTALVTCLHLWANVGFERTLQGVRAALGLVRPTLRVGFLPVT